LRIGDARDAKKTRVHLNGMREVITIKIMIPPGMRAGDRIIFKGAGSEVRPGVFRDTGFIIEEKPHALFSRRGKNDLEIEIELTLLEALTGFRKEFLAVHERRTLIATSFSTEMISGHGTKTTVFVTHPGQEEVIVGEGMPDEEDPTKMGDLWIKYKVKFPEQFTAEQHQMLKTALS
ncbi:hypothetical protein BGZ83_001092, partial [Gryganskiella cystojenkinii]